MELCKNSLALARNNMIGALQRIAARTNCVHAKIAQMALPAASTGTTISDLCLHELSAMRAALSRISQWPESEPTRLASDTLKTLPDWPCSGAVFAG